MMNEHDIIDLLQKLAETHPSIQHNPKSRMARFTAQGEDIFAKVIESLDIEKFCVITCPDAYSTNTEDMHESDYFDHLTFNFEIGKSIEKNDEELKKKTQKEARIIAESFWREILYRIENRIDFFEYSARMVSVQKNVTQGGASNIVGYRYEITLQFQILGVDGEYQPFSV
ncbi:MAG: hypothetical protein ACOVP5_03935 [Chitinophagales bacterium]